MRSALLFALLVAISSAQAQILPVLPQNPPGLRWLEVHTPHFKVIYPAGLDTAAARTAARLEQLHGPDVVTLGVNPRPISVVMQNQTTVANAFVTFLPRHAEFFTTPDQGQGLGTVDWLDGLAVHEYRHVGQFEKARSGIGRVLSPLLGDGGLGVAAIGVPQWFFEGDAVGTETALTRSGRGRIPAFNVGLRANLLSGHLYSYQKAVNGSFTDNVPDWYVLGYFMTSYLKAHYGADVWAKSLTRYYKFPFYPFSFSNSIKRSTGLTVEKLYARSMHEVDSTWRAQQAAQPATTPAREMAVQPPARIFTQYQYPQYVTDSTVLALKTGPDVVPQLVVLGRHGAERRIFTPGQLNIPQLLSVSAGRAVWPEFQQDARWGQRIASELKVLDLKTGRLTRIGRGARYAAAALSPDGQRLVAVRTDEAYHHALVLLDATTGAVLQTLPNPRNDFYQQPRFLADGQRVVAVTLSAAGKTLRLFDPATNQARNLLPVANVNLANPQPWGRFVLYNSPQSGIDNIYAVALDSARDSVRQTFRVTSRPFGAYHAAVAPGGHTLAFHDVRATGARVVEMPLDTATWTALPVPALADVPGPYAETLAAQEPAGRSETRLLARPDSALPRYGVRRYSPLRHAFRVFSYGVVQSPDGNTVSLGLRSQDFLNTTQAFAGLGYDQAERTFSVTGALSYQGLYPVLDADVTYGGRDAAVRDVNGNLQRDQWQYTRFTAGLRLPLNLTHSKYFQSLSIGTYFLHEQVYGYDFGTGTRRNNTDALAGNALNALQTTVSYATQLKRSARGVAPRRGFALLGTWRTTPFGTGLEASQWAAQGSLYLPGLRNHDAIRLRAGYQWQNQLQYQFAPAVSFPRGEGYVSFDRLLTSSIDYNLPLAFVHWELGRVLYVQRLRAAFYGDVAQGNDSRGRVGQLNYRNVGVDALVLFNVLHLRTPVEAGVRVVFNTIERQWVVQPLAFNILL